MKPSDFLTELSTEKLAQYKTAAAADASKADKAGDFKKGNKRFSGIVKATKKQFANDEKKVGESAGLPSPSTYEETNDMFKSSGQRRIGSLTTEDEQIDGMAQGEIRAIIKNAIHIKNQLDKGVSLDGWMYSYVTTSNDHLNSVAEQINNPNIDEQELDEACWKGYHKEGNKKMFGKTYPNCVKNTNEEQEHSETCPHCGGEMVSEELMNEKKDACYYKVKSRYKVWPSAYASGALVKCRKKGASNWGTGGKSNESVAEGLNEFVPDGFSGGDDSNDLQLYLNVAKKLNMKKYKPSTAHNLIAKKMAELVDVVDDDKVDYARHMARKAQGLPSMLDQQGLAEEQLDEKWTKKYKDSINCSNPKGFSQKAHCAGKKKNESSILEGLEQVDENLHKWFKEKWVRFGPDGKIRGDCARGDDSEGKPKCLPQSKAQNLGKKGRASAAARKRREDPNPERHGKAINVNTKKK